MGWMALRFFKAILLWGFQPTFTYISKKSLYSACLQQEVKLVLITQLPDNHSVLITEQAFLFNYPDNQTRATSKFLMSLTSTIQLQRNTQLKKKTWNKWQLEMAESLYLLDTTINLSFAICYLVLFDSVVGIKKKFLYSNLSTECQYKMCEYIHLTYTHTHTHIHSHI